MLLDIFPLTASIFFLCQCNLYFSQYVTGGISVLIESIGSSISFLYVHGHWFLQVRKVFFYNFVEDIYWPVNFEIFTLFYTYNPQVWFSPCVLEILGFLMYTIIQSANSDNLNSSLSISIPGTPCCYLIALTGHPSTILNKMERQGSLVQFLILVGLLQVSLHWVDVGYQVAVYFLYYVEIWALNSCSFQNL